MEDLGMMPQTIHLHLLLAAFAGWVNSQAHPSVTVGTELYATPWNPWTLVEAMDNELGQCFKKPLKRRPFCLPS